jgi:hypothetical protein
VATVTDVISGSELEMPIEQASVDSTACLFLVAAPGLLSWLLSQASHIEAR